MTPEGLNGRLNFLKQCTRQGPNISRNDPQNMAFGKPPICVLRIGDFYHTKIVIDTVNFTFDPLQWDLNPEGIGVQPMLAKVDLNFKFIGGSSLGGPINDLQNAVSFNFFANTSVYNRRKDVTLMEDKLNSDGDKIGVDTHTFGYGSFITPNQDKTTISNDTIIDNTTDKPIVEPDVDVIDTTPTPVPTPTPPPDIEEVEDVETEMEKEAMNTLESKLIYKDGELTGGSVIKLGETRQGDLIEWTLMIENQSEEVLVIDTIVYSSGWGGEFTQSSNSWKEPILPGKSTTIGFSTKSIRVVTRSGDDGTLSRKTITVTTQSSKVNQYNQIVETRVVK
jgi:hypothetical protein